MLINRGNTLIRTRAPALVLLGGIVGISANVTGCATTKDHLASPIEAQITRQDLAYQGVTLDKWLHRCDQATISFGWRPPNLEETEQPTDDEQRAKQAIREIGPDAIPVLLKMIVSEKHYNNIYCAFNALGESAKSAVPDLRSLSQPFHHDRVRIQAIRSLAAMGPVATEAIPTLITYLNDENQTIQRLALHALSSIDTNGERSVPKIIETIQQDGLASDIQRAAVVALGNIGPNAKNALPLLIALLKKVDTKFASDPQGFGTLDTYDLRASIIYALGEMRQSAAEAVPYLRTIILREGPHPNNNLSLYLASDVIDAMTKIHTPEALQALKEAKQRAEKYSPQSTEYKRTLSRALARWEDPT